jgi:hypothetical protein
VRLYPFGTPTARRLDFFELAPQALEEEIENISRLPRAAESPLAIDFLLILSGRTHIFIC